MGAIEERLAGLEGSIRVLSAEADRKAAEQGARLRAIESQLAEGEDRMRKLELLAEAGSGEVPPVSEEWLRHLKRDPDEPPERWPVWRAGELRYPAGSS